MSVDAFFLDGIEDAESRTGICSPDVKAVVEVGSSLAYVNCL